MGAKEREVVGFFKILSLYFHFYTEIAIRKNDGLFIILVNSGQKKKNNPEVLDTIFSIMISITLPCLGSDMHFCVLIQTHRIPFCVN